MFIRPSETQCHAPGLHGAVVSIMGRRGAVVDESAAALESAGIRCLAVQVGSSNGFTDL